MNASTRLYFVIAIVLTLCPHGISARGFNGSYLTQVKDSLLQGNHSAATTEVVSRALSIMREERPVNFRILHHEKFQDTVNSLNPYTMAISGVITFQFRDEVVQIQQLLFPASGTTFLILFTPPAIILRIFQKIQRERIASHFVIWLIVLKNENDLEEVLLGLEGKLEDGTRVVLLIGMSVTACRFFSSQLDFNGKVRFFDRGTWNLKDPRSKTLLPRVLMPNLVDQYSNFHGRELAVGINNNLPFTMKSRVTDQGKVLPPSGIDFSMIDTLKAEMNFTYRVVSPADGQWGGPLPNGTVTGLVGLVYRKETDFACSAVAIIGPREQVVDFSYPYYIDSLSLVSRAPQQISRAFAVFAPFPMEVWLCLIAVTLGIGPCLKIFAKLEENMPRAEDHQPSENISLQSFAFNTFRNLVLQGSMIDTKFLSLRLPFAFWYIFCLLIWALYSGTLTAVLAIPSYEKPIDSLADLPRAIKEGFTIGTVKQTMIEYLLKDATEGIYKQTWNLLRLKDPSETLLENPVIGFNKILPSKFIFIAPTAVSVVAAATRGRENFHLGRHTFYPINYGIACPTGSPMKDKFSQLQARMVEGGLIYKWEDDEFYKVLKRADGNASDTPPAISLIHLQAAFFLLVIGYVSAAVVLMAENINDCLQNREEKRS